MSHAGFLRDHHDGSEQDVVTVVRGLVEAATEATAMPLHESVSALEREVERLLDRAPSLAGHGALLRFVVRLTLAPRTMNASHLSPLRAAGYSDREIHDVVGVVCCFSYMNRLADGLGVTAHPEKGGWAERLLGPARVAAHRRWASGDVAAEDPATGD